MIKYDIRYVKRFADKNDLKLNNFKFVFYELNHNELHNPGCIPDALLLYYNEKHYVILDKEVYYSYPMVTVHPYILYQVLSNFAVHDTTKSTILAIIENNV